MSQHVISIREIIAIALTMAKRTDFVDKPALVDGLDTKSCNPEYQRPSFGQQMVLVLQIATLGVRTTYISRLIYEVSSFRLIYEVSSFSHGKGYRNDLSDADKCW